MSVLREIAFAKLNLALHVRGRRDDGYHELETLFAFAEDGDRVSGELADDVSLAISGPFGDGLSESDNLVIRSAELMKSHFSVKDGVALSLEKQLPVASGIGGGSADAAATARLLNRLWGIGADDTELEHILAPLGADIPACIRSRTVYGKGTGTELRNVTTEAISGRAVLLINPLQSLATGPVFDKWDGIDRGGLNIFEPWEGILQGRNDLQSPAMSICAAIREVLDALEQTDADLVRMSGSGATCFALYNSVAMRDLARRNIADTCPEWWMMASSLR